MGEYDPVAALAAQVHELRAQLGQARQDAAAARATTAQWNARLEREGIGATFVMRAEIKTLREEFGQLQARVITLSDGLDAGKLKDPPVPRWDGLDQADEDAQLGALRDWVDGVLLVQYPEYELPGCWEHHRAALWELGNLHAEWQRIYDDSRGADLDRALWFHERWLPGILSRLSRAINTDAGCRKHGFGANGRRATGW